MGYRRKDRRNLEGGLEGRTICKYLVITTVISMIAIIIMATKKNRVRATLKVSSIKIHIKRPNKKG